MSEKLVQAFEQLTDALREAGIEEPIGLVLTQRDWAVLSLALPSQYIRTSRDDTMEVAGLPVHRAYRRYTI